MVTGSCSNPIPTKEVAWKKHNWTTKSTKCTKEKNKIDQKSLVISARHHPPEAGSGEAGGFAPFEVIR
jgi:hypothetical protein